MSSSHEVDVLIVGAGPAGLTLANYLAACGVSFRVIDLLPAAVRESRAHGMLGRTLMALDKLGLAKPKLGAAKSPPPVLREFFGTKLVTEIDYATVAREPYPVSLPIFQQRVVRVLETALAECGQRVEWSARLATFAMDDRNVTAKVDRNGAPEMIRAKWIIGCDGAQSTVRKMIGLDFPGETLALQRLICECDLDWKRSRDIWWTWQTKSGVVGTIFNDFTEKWHVLMIRIDEHDTASESSDFARMQTLLRQMSGDHSVRASNPTWVHADTSGSQRVAEHFISGRAVLAGDAARVFSSAAGHGVHSAIEDALNLGWKLALTISGAAVPSRLGTYDTERRGHANDVIRKTQWVQCFLKLRGGLRKVLWGLLYLVGKHLRSIGSIASKQAEKLVTDYGKSALSRGDSTDTPPRTRAGLHASETACRTGGRPSGLLEIIRGSEADLLLFSGSTADFEAVNSLRAIEQCVACLREHLRVHYVFGSQAYASDAGFGEDDPRVIVDGLESLQSAFGIREPELVYIRPDGYIGLRTQDLHPHRLCVYLGQIYRAIHDETPASPLLQ